MRLDDAKGPVRSRHAVLVRKAFARCLCGLQHGHQAGPVIGMDELECLIPGGRGGGLDSNDVAGLSRPVHSAAGEVPLPVAEPPHGLRIEHWSAVAATGFREPALFLDVADDPEIASGSQLVGRRELDRRARAVLALQLVAGVIAPIAKQRWPLLREDPPRVSGDELVELPADQLRGFQSEESAGSRVGVD